MRAAQIGADGRFYDAEGRTFGGTSDWEEPRQSPNMGQALFPARVVTRAPRVGPDSRLAGNPVSPAPLPAHLREFADVEARPASGMRFIRKVIGDWDTEIFLNRFVLPVNEPGAICFTSFRQAPPGKVMLAKIHDRSTLTWEAVDKSVLLSNAYLVCNKKIDRILGTLWYSFVPIEDGQTMSAEIDFPTITSTLGMALTTITEKSISVSDIPGTDAERGKKIGELLFAIDSARALASVALDWAAMAIDCWLIPVRTYSLLFTVVKELLSATDALYKMTGGANDATTYATIAGALDYVTVKFEYYNFLIRRAELWVAAQIFTEANEVIPAYEDFNRAVMTLLDLMAKNPEKATELRLKNAEAFDGWVEEAKELAASYNAVPIAERRAVDNAFDKEFADTDLAIGEIVQLLDANLILLEVAKNKKPEAPAAALSGLGGLEDLGTNGGAAAKKRKAVPKPWKVKSDFERVLESEKKYIERLDKTIKEKIESDPKRALLQKQIEFARMGQITPELQAAIAEVESYVRRLLSAEEGPAREMAERLAVKENERRKRANVSDLQPGEFTTDASGKRIPRLITAAEITPEMIRRELKGVDLEVLERNLRIRVKKAGGLLAELGRLQAKGVEELLASGREKRGDLSNVLEQARKAHGNAATELNTLKGNFLEANKTIGRYKAEGRDPAEIKELEAAREKVKEAAQRQAAVVAKLEKSIKYLESNHLVGVQRQYDLVKEKWDILVNQLRAAENPDKIAVILKDMATIVVGDLPRLARESGAYLGRPELTRAGESPFSPKGFTKRFISFASGIGMDGSTAANVLVEYVRSYFHGSVPRKFKIIKEFTFGGGATKDQLQALKEIRERLVDLRSEVQLTLDANKANPLGAEYKHAARLLNTINSVGRSIEVTIENGGVYSQTDVYKDALGEIERALVEKRPLTPGQIGEVLSNTIRLQEEMTRLADSDAGLIERARETLSAQTKDGKEPAAADQGLLQNTSGLEKLYGELKGRIKALTEMNNIFKDAAKEEKRELTQVTLEGVVKEQRAILDIYDRSVPIRTNVQQRLYGWTARRVWDFVIDKIHWAVNLPLRFAKTSADKLELANASLNRSLIVFGGWLVNVVWWTILSAFFGVIFFKDTLNRILGLAKLPQIGPNKPKDSQFGPGDEDATPEEKPPSIWDVALVGLVIGAITVPRVIFPTVAGLVRDTFGLVRDVLLPGRVRRGPGRPAGAKAPAGERRGPGRPPGTGKKQEIAAKFVKVQRIYQQAKASGDEARATQALRRLHRLKAEYEAE